MAYGNVILPPAIIDVEASGFGPDSYPIEVGVVLDNGEKYCTLVQPAPDWTHWDENAEMVHRVSRDILAEHGKPMRAVAEELNAIIGTRDVYTDGWVVDSTWIIKLFQAAGLASAFSVRALEMILTEAQMEIWHDTKERVLREMALKRHRASNDAVIIQQTYMATHDEQKRREPA